MDVIARLANLPGALPGACAQGLIWGIMAIGVYLTYRILDVADLTVDGSFGTGGAVCVMCLLSGQNVWVTPQQRLISGQEHAARKVRPLCQQRFQSQPHSVVPAWQSVEQAGNADFSAERFYLRGAGHYDP